MKTSRIRRRSAQQSSERRGFAAMEVIVAAVVVLAFTMGLYYLGEKNFSRLYHFISTMVGSPYL